METSIAAYASTLLNRLESSGNTDLLNRLEGITGARQAVDSVPGNFMDYIRKAVNITGENGAGTGAVFSPLNSQGIGPGNPEATADIARSALQVTVDAGKLNAETADNIQEKLLKDLELHPDRSLMEYGGKFGEAMAAFIRWRMAPPVEPAMETPPVEAPAPISAPPEAEGSKSLKFSWKHIASDGNLAVLIPQPLSDNIAKVEVLDSNNRLIETGNYSKTTGDNRAVYRFSKPGDEYGDNLKVVITYEGGRTVTYNIPDGGVRTSEWLTGSAEARYDATPTVAAGSTQENNASQNSSGTEPEAPVEETTPTEELPAEELLTGTDSPTEEPVQNAA